jgi:hypothetical protein
MTVLLRRAVALRIQHDPALGGVVLGPWRRAAYIRRSQVICYQRPPEFHLPGAVGGPCLIGCNSPVRRKRDIASPKYVDDLVGRGIDHGHEVVAIFPTFSVHDEAIPAGKQHVPDERAPAIDEWNGSDPAVVALEFNAGNVSLPSRIDRSCDDAGRFPPDLAGVQDRNGECTARYPEDRSHHCLPLRILDLSRKAAPDDTTPESGASQLALRRHFRGSGHRLAGCGAPGLGAPRDPERRLAAAVIM